MKVFLLLTICISYLNGISQTLEFDRAFRETSLNNYKGETLKFGDTISNSYFDAKKKITDNLKGVQYPNVYLPSINNDSTYLYSIIADEVILNFNYFSCDYCINQLNDFITYKKKFNKKIVIISVFEGSLADIKTLIPKYDNTISFISDFNNKPEYYTLNSGTPSTYILDKNKNILQILNFDNQTIK